MPAVPRKSLWTVVLAVTLMLSALLPSPASAAPTAWSNWQGLGVCQSGCITPTVASWGPGRLDVLALTTNYQLISNTYANGLWSGWQFIGGPQLVMRSLTAVSWGPGRVDVFAVQQSNGAGGPLLQNTFTNGAWAGWQNLGGNSNTSIAVSSWGAGRLDLFANDAVNPDDPSLTLLRHRAFVNGAWQAWESLGNNAFVSGAVSPRSGRIDIVASDDDLNVKHRWFDGGTWSGWESLAGPVLTGPVITASGNRLDVFIQGRDELLYQRTFAGGWGGWTPVPMGPYSAIADPAAVSWGAGRIDVFGQTNRNSPYAVTHNTLTY